MSVKKVTKRSDPAVRRLRAVRDREWTDLVFCEGYRLIEEAIKSGWPVDALFATDETVPRARELLRTSKRGAPLTVLSADVMSFVSDVSTPPGLVALVTGRAPAEKPRGVPLELVLSGLQLPQNVGALVRVAEAAGVSAIATTRTCADPWGPKALRGSAGSAFRVPIQTGAAFSELLDGFRSAGLAAVAATQNGTIDYDRFDWNRPAALAIGSEARGFTEEELARFDARLRIPMLGRVESLNAATAGAVCLFEAARQRRNNQVERR